MPLEARSINGPWIPFFPENYEKLNVDENLEWRVVSSSPLIASDIIQRPGASTL